jgi:hypothetical protein
MDAITRTDWLQMSRAMIDAGRQTMQAVAASLVFSRTRVRPC